MSIDSPSLPPAPSTSGGSDGSGVTPRNRAARLAGHRQDVELARRCRSRPSRPCAGTTRPAASCSGPGRRSCAPAAATGRRPELQRHARRNASICSLRLRRTRPRCRSASSSPCARGRARRSSRQAAASRRSRAPPGLPGSPSAGRRRCVVLGGLSPSSIGRRGASSLPASARRPASVGRLVRGLLVGLLVDLLVGRTPPRRPALAAGTGAGRDLRRPRRRSGRLAGGRDGRCRRRRRAPTSGPARARSRDGADCSGCAAPTTAPVPALGGCLRRLRRGRRLLLLLERGLGARRARSSVARSGLCPRRLRSSSR